MLKVFCAVFCSLFFAGCGIVSFKSIPQNAEYREYKGIKIYSERIGRGEDDWKAFFEEIDLANESFIGCVGTDGRKIARLKPIILVSEDLFLNGKKLFGLNDLKYIYLNKNRRYAKMLAHEWLHSYLYIYRGYLTGDPGHEDPLWQTCGLYSKTGNARFLVRQYSC